MSRNLLIVGGEAVKFASLVAAFGHGYTITAMTFEESGVEYECDTFGVLRDDRLARSDIEALKAAALLGGTWARTHRELRLRGLGAVPLTRHLPKTAQSAVLHDAVFYAANTLNRDDHERVLVLGWVTSARRVAA